MVNWYHGIHPEFTSKVEEEILAELKTLNSKLDSYTAYGLPLLRRICQALEKQRAYQAGSQISSTSLVPDNTDQ